MKNKIINIAIAILSVYIIVITGLTLKVIDKFNFPEGIVVFHETESTESIEVEDVIYDIDLKKYDTEQPIVDGQYSVFRSYSNDFPNLVMRMYYKVGDYKDNTNYQVDVGPHCRFSTENEGDEDE